MEKRNGGHRIASIFTGKTLTVRAVPGYLAVADIVVAVNLFLPFQDYGIHGVKEIKYMLHPAGAGKCKDVIGTAVNAAFQRKIHAARKAANSLEHVFAGASKLGVVVSERHGPRNAALGQRRKDFHCAFNVRAAENHVSCVYHKVRLHRLHGLFHAFQGAPGTRISANVMRIRKL